VSVFGRGVVRDRRVLRRRRRLHRRCGHRRGSAAMTELLALSPDEVLSTTRAVRKRLDFTRAVPDDVIRECVRLAMQAPAGSNIPRTRFVVVRDPETRRKLAALYNQVYTDLYT